MQKPLGAQKAGPHRPQTAQHFNNAPCPNSDSCKSLGSLQMHPVSVYNAGRKLLSTKTNKPNLKPSDYVTFIEFVYCQVCSDLITGKQILILAQDATGCLKSWTELPQTARCFKNAPWPNSDSGKSLGSLQMHPISVYIHNASCKLLGTKPKLRLSYHITFIAKFNNLDKSVKVGLKFGKI